MATYPPTHTMPAKVRQAADRRDEVLGLSREAWNEADALARELPEAHDRDRREGADAAKAGEPIPAPKHAPQHQLRLAEARHRAESLDLAVTEREVELATAVEVNAEAWTASNAKLIDEEIAKAHAALAQFEKARKVLADAIATESWLKSGHQGMWRHRPLHSTLRGPNGEPHGVDALAAELSQVLDTVSTRVTSPPPRGITEQDLRDYHGPRRLRHIG